MYQKLLFLAGFYILFTAITVNATSLNIIKKNYQPITKNIIQQLLLDYICYQLLIPQK